MNHKIVVEIINQYRKITKYSTDLLQGSHPDIKHIVRGGIGNLSFAIFFY